MLFYANETALPNKSISIGDIIVHFLGNCVMYVRGVASELDVSVLVAGCRDFTR
jgi:hypothetical protein